MAIGDCFIPIADGQVDKYTVKTLNVSASVPDKLRKDDAVEEILKQLRRQLAHELMTAFEDTEGLFEVEGGYNILRQETVVRLTMKVLVKESK